MMPGHQRGLPSWGGRLAATLLALVAATGVAGLDPKFLFPEISDMIVHNGDTIAVQYISDYDFPTLKLWCREPGKEDILGKGEKNARSNNATEYIKIDLENIEGCWFNLWHTDTEGINSFAFKLDEQNPREGVTLSMSADETTSTTTRASTTTSSAKTTTTTTTTTSSHTIPTTSATRTGSATTSTPTSPVGSDQEGNASSELSTGAKAGVGAGIAVAGVLAVVGLVFFMLARRKQREYQTMARSEGNSQLDVMENGANNSNSHNYDNNNNNNNNNNGGGVGTMYVGYYDQDNKPVQQHEMNMMAAQHTGSSGTMMYQPGTMPGQQHNASQYYDGNGNPGWVHPQNVAYAPQVGGRQEMLTAELGAAEMYSGDHTVSHELPPSSVGEFRR